MRKVGDLFEFVSTDTGDYMLVMYAPSYSTLLVDLLHKAGYIYTATTGKSSIWTPH